MQVSLDLLRPQNLLPGPLSSVLDLCHLKASRHLRDGCACLRGALRQRGEQVRCLRVVVQFHFSLFAFFGLESIVLPRWCWDPCEGRG